MSRSAADPTEDVIEYSASEDDLRQWVERISAGRVTLWEPISGGNRCRSWAVDTTSPAGLRSELYLRYQPPRPPSAEPYTVWREAEFYSALAGSNVPAPRLIAVHGDFPAIVTERVPGKADFRRLQDSAEKSAIARDFVQALATLHALPLVGEKLAKHRSATMADCVATEIAIWRAMYEESGRVDPLIDLALDWLTENLPHPDEPPVFVHGDAGPGNFLFEHGRMTALLDWELAHVGDPMEDLAWFSMRCVMEPVPDFAATIREYEKASGRSVDLFRIRYHRVFVSTRVVIIRHRNVTGEPGNSIVSKALNRRLLIDALAAATQIKLAPRLPLDEGPTARTELYDAVLDDLRDRIASASTDSSVVAAAKNAAKVLKYLREFDRLGAVAEKHRLANLSMLLNRKLETSEQADAALKTALSTHGISFETLIHFFAEEVGREAQIAALSSGGLAERKFPSLEELDRP